MYDPRLGKFLSIDPKWQEYIYQSPYAYAFNNPIRFIDVFGEWPGDRIKAAQKYLATKYKQQTGGDLRTGQSKAALEYMDCSELMCRVLAADKFTTNVKSMATSDNSMQKWLIDNWEEVQSPKAGDIIIWNGHTALVEKDYVVGKRISVIHATKYGNVSSVVEEKYKMSYYQGKGAKFYRPKVDKPDGDLDGANSVAKKEESPLFKIDFKMEKKEPKFLTDLKKSFEKNNIEIEKSKKEFENAMKKMQKKWDEEKKTNETKTNETKTNETKTDETKTSETKS